jgi:hypothetical protein
MVVLFQLYNLNKIARMPTSEMPTQREDQMAAPSKGIALKDTFEAYLELLPPHPIRILNVNGKVEYRSGGVTASLIKAVPQGINPAILILEVHDTTTGGPSTDPVVTQSVSFDAKATTALKQVTIRSAAPDFTIDVQGA